MTKATVFISCGQRDDKEKQIGSFLEEYFQKKGFNTYFAEHIHSSKPLLQSILEALKKSEYFIAYNPYRKDNGNIGSLFIQQEISAAALLEIPTLYFYQKGVNKICGMSGALHLNGIEMNDITQLKKKLDNLTTSWNNTSKNQLFLEFGNPNPNVQDQHGNITNWYHVSCLNKSTYKHAKNCMAYIEKITNITSNTEIVTPYQCELIWAGTGIHTLTIRKQTKRDFDAIVTIQGSNLWQFQTLQTSTIYIYPPIQNGRYKINYVVMSDNFSDARLEVEIELQNDIAKIIDQKQL